VPRRDPDNKDRKKRKKKKSMAAGGTHQTRKTEKKRGEKVRPLKGHANGVLCVHFKERGEITKTSKRGSRSNRSSNWRKRPVFVRGIGRKKRASQYEKKEGQGGKKYGRVGRSSDEQGIEEKTKKLDPAHQTKKEKKSFSKLLSNGGPGTFEKDENTTKPCQKGRRRKNAARVDALLEHQKIRCPKKYEGEKSDSRRDSSHAGEHMAR